jgi:NADH pyrophosphatase NudC (nudix superfamily)
MIKPIDIIGEAVRNNRIVLKTREKRPMLTRKNLTVVMVVALMAALSMTVLAGGPSSKMTIKVLEKIYDAAEFDHKQHTDAGYKCTECHHKSVGKKVTTSCNDCHDDPEKPVAKKDFVHEDHYKDEDCSSCHDYKSQKDLACSSCHKVSYDKKNPAVIGLKGALHMQCMGCHKENGVKNDCVACHAKKKKK